MASNDKTSRIEFGYGSDGLVPFNNPWIFDTFSWNRLQFRTAQFYLKYQQPTHISITLYGRNPDGSIDTTNAIVADYNPGSTMSLIVKVDGIAVSHVSRDWEEFVYSSWPDANLSEIELPYALEVTYAPGYGVRTHLFTVDGQWFGIGVADYDVEFPAYTSVVPVLTAADPSRAHQFWFNDFEVGVPPQHPDTGAPDDPIPVKTFAMKPEWWKAFNPNNPELPDWYFFRMEGQVAHFEYHSFWHGVYQHPVTVPEGQGLMWEVMLPYVGPYWEIGLGNTAGEFMSIRGGDSPGDASATWLAGNSSDSPGIVGIAGVLKFFRIYRRSGRLTGEASTNGQVWRTVGTTARLTNPNDVFVVDIHLEGFVDILQMRGVTVAGNPDPTPPIWNPPEEPDPFDPNVLQPEGGEGSSTVLDLVRDFSRAVKRAVRITGTDTIAMVDPATPLPAGMSQADADDMYTNAGRGTGADTEVLSLNKGKVSLTSTCRMVTNDVRVIKSSWRIPDRLPVYGLSPAHVQRVSYTFTPTDFSASFEFRFPFLPLVTKEK